MIKENILAIPSKDRLNDESIDLLVQAGIDIQIPGRQLSTEITLPELGSFTVALMRPKDIVRMVAAGDIPVGIAGMDTVEEYRLSWKGGSLNVNRVQTLLPLGIGRCRLVLAASEKSSFKTEEEFEELRQKGEYVYGFPTLRQFNGLTIATSYPGIVRDYFSDAYAASDGYFSVDFSIRELSGSVEALPALGMADAIADLVETGKSLEANKLREIKTIFESQAVLITNYWNKKGDDPFVDNVRDAIFNYLLRTGNPDAIARQQRFEAMIASFR